LGGTVAVSLAPGASIAKQYDILHSTGLNGTTFSGVSANSLPGLSASLSYSATDAYLGLTSVLGPLSTGLGSNAQRVAGVIDAAFNAQGSLP
ncbi:hypothetical protein, partial [Anoxybacillus sp. LAT27]|uniref:hypothetical protein n=1 Tax=Anoxybacillus sp. LAT27 TaxID=2878409 RepID=UPI001EDBE146